MQLCGRHYATGEPIEVELVEGRIAEIGSLALDDSRREACPWLCPGLLDLQINGYGGEEFSSATLTEAKVEKIADEMGRFGVTRFFPTVTTQSPSVMEHALRVLSATCRSAPRLARRMPGIHVEGPFICPEDGARGAHPLEFVRPPDWDEFQRMQEAAEGRIRVLTLSPEYDESLAFIRRVADSGVVVSIGHTGAAPERIRAAADAGARLSTHLGNGSHTMLPRLRNYLWEQLAEDRLMAGMIVDGHHLPPAVVKSMVRAKTPERCILVCDLSGQAGQPPGRYSSPFCDVEILPTGKLVVAGQTEVLAGATVPTSECLANVMSFAGVDLATAVHMGVHHPAKLVGLEVDELETGSAANLMQFGLTRSEVDGLLRIDIRAVVLDGELLHGCPWTP